MAAVLLVTSSRSRALIWTFRLYSSFSLSLAHSGELRYSAAAVVVGSSTEVNRLWKSLSLYMLLDRVTHYSFSLGLEHSSSREHHSTVSRISSNSWINKRNVGLQKESSSSPSSSSSDDFIRVIRRDCSQCIDGGRVYARTVSSPPSGPNES